MQHNSATINPASLSKPVQQRYINTSPLVKSTQSLAVKKKDTGCRSRMPSPLQVFGDAGPGESQQDSEQYGQQANGSTQAGRAREGGIRAPSKLCKLCHHTHAHAAAGGLPIEPQAIQAHIQLQQSRREHPASVANNASLPHTQLPACRVLLASKTQHSRARLSSLPFLPPSLLPV